MKHEIKFWPGQELYAIHENKLQILELKKVEIHEDEVIYFLFAPHYIITLEGRTRYDYITRNSKQIALTKEELLASL